MRIRKLQFCNMFAYGNEMQTIDFDDLQGITHINGTNGVGKTSINKLIQIGIYFEYGDMPVGEIANEINGNGQVMIDLSSRGHEWTIKSSYNFRGLSSISVTKDGKIQDTGDIPNSKAYVISNIADVPFSIFANLVSLDISEFKSLLSLNVRDSRAIRDKLLSLEDINAVKDMLSTGNKAVNAELKERQDKVFATTKVIEDIEDQIKNENWNFAVIKPHIEELHASLKKAQPEIEKLKKAITDNEQLQQKLELWNKAKEYKEISEKTDELAIMVGKYSSEHSETCKKLSEVKAEIHQCEASIKHHGAVATKFNNERLQSEIEELQRVSFNTNSDKILMLKDKLTSVEAAILNNKKINSLIDTCDSIISIFQSLPKKELLCSVAGQRIEKLATISSSINESLFSSKHREKALEKAISVGDTCPECGQSIEDKKADHEAELASVKNQIQELEKKKWICNAIKCHYEEQRSNNSTDVDKHSLSSLTKTLFDGVGVDAEKRSVMIKMSSIESIKKKLSGRVMTEISVSDEKIAALKEEIKSLESKDLGADTKKAQILADIKKLQSQMKPVNEDDLSIAAKYSTEEAIKKSQIEKSLLEELTKEEKILASKIESTKLELNHNTALLAKTEQFKDAEKVDESSVIDVGAVKDQLRSLIAEANKNKEEFTMLTQRHTTKLESLKSVLESQQKEIEQLNVEIDKLSADRKYELYLEQLLQEGNFKKYAISTITPRLNESINFVANEFNFPIKCQFDEDFKPKLTRFGKPARIISLGQRKIVDMIVVLSVLHLIKIRYPDINFVFYDEVFGNLSSQNTAMMLEQIRKLCVEKHGISVFLVNHAFVSDELFDNSISITNNGTFSKLSVKHLKSDGREIGIVCSDRGRWVTTPPV